MNRQNILDLTIEARHSEKSYRKLVAEINKMQREANKRLRALESKEYNSPAYKSATYYTSHRFTSRTKRFKRTSLKSTPFTKQNIKEQTRYALQLSHFLDLETSTTEGYEESIDKSLDTLFSRLGVATDREVFKEFLKSEYFKEFVKKGSDQVMSFGIDNIETLDDIERLDELYTRYKKGEIYAADITDDWTSL